MRRVRNITSHHGEAEADAVERPVRLVRELEALPDQRAELDAQPPF